MIIYNDAETDTWRESKFAWTDADVARLNEIIGREMYRVVKA